MSPRSERSLADAASVGVLADFAPPPRVKTLTSVFEARAAKSPKATAIICGTEALTYADVEARANRLAYALMKRGIGAGSFVAVFLRRSSDVYVSLLAIMKAGAAYVPLDADYPTERVQFILNDAGAHCVVTTRAMCLQHALKSSLAFCLDEQRDYLASLPTVATVRSEALASSPAYVIYTSGSTGRPKGVLVSHQSAVHLVQAEAEIFRVGPSDRVFQGFSIAFDASVEEIWLAFRAGAALVVGTDEVMQLGPALCTYLAEARVTVWSTVPTLLSLQESGVPSLRLLILGGEACSKALVERWWRHGLRLVNTYGPTEATVIATYADCFPHAEVTIGRAVPGYRLLVVDADLRPTPDGEPGELLIGGPGLALGYVGRADLTAEKFISLTLVPGITERLYRTGDLVRYNFDGQLEFLGRIDDQVKVRGFRIELGEIESVLLGCAGVRSAAVAVHGGPGEVQSLVAYLVARPEFNEAVCREQVKAKLPKYMWPSHVQLLAELPVLPSGKVDRKALPVPACSPGGASMVVTWQGATPLEVKLLQIWSRLLHPQPVGLDDDFFDLGGHSLLATKLISELRQDPDLRDAAVVDLYRYPTIKSLGLALTKPPALPTPAAALPLRTPVQQPSSPLAQRLAGAVAQACGFYLIYGLLALSWVSVYYGMRAIADSSHALAGLGAACGAFVAVLLVQLLVPVLCKWLVIGRFKPGRYPVWGTYYWRFWFVRSMLTYFGPSYLIGTPWLPLYYRLLGAKIGRGVQLNTDEIVAADLLTIGDGASVNAHVRLLGFTLEGGYLHLGPVTIGSEAYVGARSVLQPGSSLGDGARLGALSLLPVGAHVPKGSSWAGAPARPHPVALPPSGPKAAVLTRSKLGRGVLAGFYAAAVVVAMLVPVTAFVPVFAGIGWVEERTGWLIGAVVTPLLVALGVVLMCLLVAALKWLMVGRVKAGTYPVHGAFYVRKWFVDLQMSLSLSLLSPLYATTFLPYWLRLLGAKIGRHAEISTAANMTPDLIDIADDCFVADDVCLGAGTVFADALTLAPVRLGKASFTGNSAVVSGGHSLADDGLLGCLTASTPCCAKEAGASWLGSPAIRIPKREAKATFDRDRTYKPSRRLQALRMFIELGRITLPGSLLITLSRLYAEQVAAALMHARLAQVLLLPLQLMLWGAAGVAAVIAAKWLLVGRYRAGVKPLWSTFVWRSELINALHEQVGEFFLTAFGLGTPLVAIYFRLMGTRVGRGVVLDTANITEFDLVDIGDGAMIGWNSDLQTHLFEDRIMKMDGVHIGAQSSVGEATLVLYDAEVKPHAAVGGLSLVMKGETIPAGTPWLGIPVQPMRASEPLPIANRRLQGLLNSHMAPTGTH